MSNLLELEKNLDKTSKTYLVMLRMTKEIDRNKSAKLDTLFERILSILGGKTSVPKSLVSKLIFIPCNLMKQADISNDPTAVRAAALCYLERIFQMLSLESAEDEGA
jgi:hypothetical protein